MVYAYRSRMIINNVPFHTQKCRFRWQIIISPLLYVIDQQKKVRQWDPELQIPQVWFENECCLAARAQVIQLTSLILYVPGENKILARDFYEQ